MYYSRWPTASLVKDKLIVFLQKTSTLMKNDRNLTLNRRAFAQNVGPRVLYFGSTLTFPDFYFYTAYATHLVYF